MIHLLNPVELALACVAYWVGCWALVRVTTPRLATGTFPVAGLFYAGLVGWIAIDLMVGR